MHLASRQPLVFAPEFRARGCGRYPRKRRQTVLTDCNTLYPGRRKNALEHLDAAAEKRFSVASTGCQVLHADGLKGLDEKIVRLRAPNM
jgi:uncharacterized Fe-S center protein